jgi:hypothetical protein
MERSRGIKPLASAWKAEVLSLYELRKLVAPPGFEPGLLSNLETMPNISRVFYR